MKKVLALLLAAVMIFPITACSKNIGSGKTANVTMNSLKLGTDYTDIKANLTFFTHKTDEVNTTFKTYVKEFQKLYPNVKITYEGDTNYATDMTTRLTTRNWGDICMIPPSIKKNELSNHFIPFGKRDTLSKNYRYLDNFTYQGETYGIPSMSNIQGLIYNKRIFKEAGITSLPKTPDEFLSDLAKIKAKTDAIPLYTNFAAGWTLTAWDAYITSGATGDSNAQEKMTKTKTPFSKPADGSESGPYYVYYTLYQAVNRGLTEKDPTTTDWEGSKGQMNKGNIACMALGSWAISQIQGAGSNGSDIGYMPFPITVNGKQYVNVAPDYNYAINKNSSRNNQIAALLYIKWLVEKSNFDVDQGGIPTVKTHSNPAVLKDFSSDQLLIDNPLPDSEADLYNEINTGSELSLNSDSTHGQQIVEAAEKGKPSLDNIMNDWNSKWATAEGKYTSK